MPQARTRHQPRAASNRPKTPAEASRVASQKDWAKVNAAPTSSAIPISPRTSRPLPSMLRAKNFFIGLLFSKSDTSVARSSAAGEQPPKAEAVVALSENAGQIRDQGIAHHDQISPPGIPEEEHCSTAQGEPVTEFP